MVRFGAFGFDPARVATDRGGIAESITGRMLRNGDVISAPPRQQGIRIVPMIIAHIPRHVLAADENEQPKRNNEAPSPREPRLTLNARRRLVPKVPQSSHNHGPRLSR